MTGNPPVLLQLNIGAKLPTRSAAQRPRQVGVCLKHLSDDPESQFNSTNVPWQRVINAKGIISPRLDCLPTYLPLAHTLRGGAALAVPATLPFP